MLTFLVALIVDGSFQYYRSTHTPARNTHFSFSFDGTKAPGWWSGTDNWPSVQQQGGDQATIKNPTIVQMSVAQGSPTKPGACFVMYFYKKGSINIGNTLNDMKASVTKGDAGLVLDESNAITLTINTFEGTKRLQLHQYSLSGSPGNTTTRGIEFGLAQLGDGYIEIRGYCEIAAQIDDTLPALNSVSLKD